MVFYGNIFVTIIVRVQEHLCLSTYVRKYVSTYVCVFFMYVYDCHLNLG